MQTAMGAVDVWLGHPSGYLLTPRIIPMREVAVWWMMPPKLKGIVHFRYMMLAILYGSEV